MERKLALHFFFLVTFLFTQLSLEAQTNKGSDCSGININPIITAACVNGSLGQVDLEIDQGIPPYRIKWSDGSTVGTRKLGAGEYSVQVTDALGCAGSIDFTIPTQVALEARSQVNHTSKAGRSNGSIAVSVSGGSPPYRYTWISSQDGVMHAAIEGVSQLRKVPAGFYQVLVFDASGCYVELNTEVR